MSIYLFKTEQFYGGVTKLFTDKLEAEIYLAEFIKRTESKIDAEIEEHHPFPQNKYPMGNSDGGTVVGYQIGLDVFGHNAIVSYDGRFDNLDSIDVNEIAEFNKK